MAAQAGNIALVGMPGAGKSTLGVLFAKRAAYGFVDIDLLIQEAEGRTLREIIAERGAEEFRRSERRCVLALECSKHVIATGGSVVYCDSSMAHLQRLARIVYLYVPLETLRLRLGDLDARGVVHAPGQDLDGLYALRRVLYERWADIRVDCGDLEHDGVVRAVIRALASA